MMTHTTKTKLHLKHEDVIILHYRLYAYYGSLDCTSSPANRKYRPNEFELHVYYSPTGIDENDASVKVFPNPAKGFVTVEAEGMKSVSVYNTLGQCILQKIVAGNQTTVDLQNASEGLYLLRIETEKGTCSKRITLARQTKKLSSLTPQL